MIYSLRSWKIDEIANAILVSGESMDLPALHGSVVHKLAARNKGNGHLYTIDWYGLDM